jgi:hypothetical protein
MLLEGKGRKQRFRGRGFVLENKALKEHLAGMISQEKRRNTCF